MTLILIVSAFSSGLLPLELINPTIAQLDFEDQLDFAVDGTQWWGSQSTWGITNPLNRFELSSEQSHSGLSSAKFSLLNPDSSPNPSDSFRLEILHNWNASTLKEVEQVSWVYLPEGFPVDGFVALHRTLYERYFPSNYWYNGFQVGLFIDGRSSRPTYGQPIFVVTLNNGVVANGLTGADYYPSDTKQVYENGQYVWINGAPELVPKFGEWFKVKTYAYRDINNWYNGHVKVWFAFAPDYQEQLVYDLGPVRTIGIDPVLLGSSDNQLSSGISLYTNLGAQPKYCYFDDLDFKYTSYSFSPTPTPSPTATTPLVTPLPTATPINSPLPTSTPTPTNMPNSDSSQWNLFEAFIKTLYDMFVSWWWWPW